MRQQNWSTIKTPTRHPQCSPCVFLAGAASLVWRNDTANPVQQLVYMGRALGHQAASAPVELHLSAQAYSNAKDARTQGQ